MYLNKDSGGGEKGKEGMWLKKNLHMIKVTHWLVKCEKNGSDRSHMLPG